MTITRSFVIALTLAPLLAACAAPERAAVDVAPLKTVETGIGPVLADAKGMTLYTYSKDPTGVSECFGRCARKWPPAAVTAAPPPGSDLTIIDRKDGTRQYAWRGRPLYTWAKDKEPSQTTGHNLGEVWFAARP